MDQNVFKSSLFSRKSLQLIRVQLLTVTAVAHPVPIHCTPSLSKDINVIIVHYPLIAPALIDDMAHISTKWFIKAISLDAVPGRVWRGQGGVSGAHWEAGVRGPVACHISSLLLHICKIGAGCQRENSKKKYYFHCGNS